MIKFSYLGGDLSTAQLKKLVSSHNERHAKEFHVKLKGSSNVELPAALMASFFTTLFENIKNKVIKFLF
jgi:hypothetical protein